MARLLAFRWRSVDEQSESTEWREALHECHIRNSKRLLHVCSKNGGIYVKLGQHLAQLEYLIPPEYIQTMEVMYDRAPTKSFEDVIKVFQHEFGQHPEKVFKKFGQEPIASASLAQVHIAYTWNDQKVAVKVVLLPYLVGPMRIGEGPVDIKSYPDVCMHSFRYCRYNTKDSKRLARGISRRSRFWWVVQLYCWMDFSFVVS